MHKQEAEVTWKSKKEAVTRKESKSWKKKVLKKSRFGKTPATETMALTLQIEEAP